jgi:hypothetical protein
LYTVVFVVFTQRTEDSNKNKPERALAITLHKKLKHHLVDKLSKDQKSNEIA